MSKDAPLPSSASVPPAPLDWPVDFEAWDEDRQHGWIADHVLSCVDFGPVVMALDTRPTASRIAALADRPGICAWEARALAGVKRMHEDEAYRLSLNTRLS